MCDNCGSLEVLAMQMTLDEDAAYNVRLGHHRWVGIGSVASGALHIVSGGASYASVLSMGGMNPGQLTFTVLFLCPEY